MKIRFVSALLALALPLAAQAPAAAETEALFYKAYWLEKGERDLIGAMALYEQFLGKAPEHKLASEAAKQQFGLLSSTGKTKERDAFKVKYEKLLGNVANVAPSGERPARGEGDAPRGDGAGRPGGAGGAGRADPAARMAELEKQLAKAKEEGNAEEVKKVEAQIERAKQMAERGGRGQGGQGQGGQGRRGGMGALMGTKKLSEMTADELTQFKDGLAGMDTMLERMRETLGEEASKKLETNLGSLKKGLEGNKLDDAQKALDAIREALPQRRGRGGEAGAGAGRGGNNGGGGGTNGGGGGTNGGGGGR